VLVPRECVGDRAPGPHDAALFDIHAKYGDVVELADAVGYLRAQDTARDRGSATQEIMRSVYQPRSPISPTFPARSRWVANGRYGCTPRLRRRRGAAGRAARHHQPGDHDGLRRRTDRRPGPAVILDVRGRGLSDGGGEYSLEEYAEDTEALIRGLGLDAPLLLGHSMGARIAAVTAVRARVPLRGTVLGDPPMSGPGRGPYPTPLAAFLAQLDQAKRGTDADEVARSWPRWPRRELELRARWLSSCDEQAITLTHRGFETRTSSTGGPRCPRPRR
jgi:N-formylmaleamate deformylase